MPLDFAENDKPKPPVEFFVTNTKARPLDLEGEVLPELIRLCGDVKSGRITVEMVEAYLDKNVLIFDRALLKNLFSEADFRNEGSLDAKALKAALSARYPKRQLHREWRDLVALLLRVPELVLADDIKQTKLFDGTFNKDSVWDSPPKELPKAPKRRKPKKKTLSSTQGTDSSQQDGAGPSGSTLTAEGRKSIAEPAEQAKINALGLTESRSTFAATREFDKLQRSLELEAAFRTMSTAAAPTELTEQTVMATNKQSIRAWSSSLTPTAINIPSSALSTLRASVRSTMARKPAFLTAHAPLTAAETDLKKTLGQPMDVSVALNRVEPVRPTEVLPNASYLQWGDYASQCRSAPSAWYNEHPAAPAPPAEHPWC